MEIQPAGTPTGDPFFDAVRRRHPNVDIVLLPARPAPALGRPEASDADAERARHEVAETAGEVWRAAAPLSDKLPEARFSFGATPQAVRATERVVDHRSDGYGVLVSLRHELEERGWELERPAGGLERLVGRCDAGTVTASYAEQTGTFVLELASGDLLVGADTARRLVRGRS